MGEIERKADLEAGRLLIEERRSSLKAANVNLNKLVKEFAIIAFSDIKDYIEVAEGGELSAIPLDSISPKKATRAVKKIREHTRITESDDGSRIFKDSNLEYELYDKMDALKYLTKLGGWEPAQQQNLTLQGNGSLLFKVVYDEKPIPDGDTD